MKFGINVQEGLNAMQIEEIVKMLASSGIKCTQVAKTPLVDTRTGEVVYELVIAACESSWFKYKMFQVLNGLKETIGGADGFHLLHL